MSADKVTIPYTLAHVAPGEIPGGTPGGRDVRQHDLDALAALGSEGLHDLLVDVVMAIAQITGCSVLDVVARFVAAAGNAAREQARRN